MIDPHSSTLHNFSIPRIRKCDCDRVAYKLSKIYSHIQDRLSQLSKEYILISRIVTICHENLEIFAKVIIYD